MNCESTKSTAITTASELVDYLFTNEDGEEAYSLGTLNRYGERTGGAFSKKLLLAKVEELVESERNSRKHQRVLSNKEWIALTSALEATPDISIDALTTKAKRLVESRTKYAQKVLQPNRRR